MPVFDFKHTPDEKKAQECTYTTFRSNETEATAEKPMLVLDNSNRKWKHHSCGVFTNPKTVQTAMQYTRSGRSHSVGQPSFQLKMVSCSSWSSVFSQAVHRQKKLWMRKWKKTATAWSWQACRVSPILWTVQEEPFRTISVCGQEETLLLQDHMKCHRKKEDMRRELFQSWWIFSGRAIILNPLIRMRQEESWMKSFTEWNVSNRESSKQSSRSTERTLFRRMESFWSDRPEPVNRRSLMQLHVSWSFRGQLWIWVPLTIRNSLQEVPVYTPMRNRELLWKHLRQQENPTWYSSSMSWTKQHPEKEMGIRRMYFWHSLITLDLRITIWSVWFRL